jgi:hypothetical protein
MSWASEDPTGSEHARRKMVRGFANAFTRKDLGWSAM